MSLETKTTPLQFGQLRVGDVFGISKAFNYPDMDQFAALSGDYSGIHTNARTAIRLGFSDRIQYGFLLSGLLSGIVGENFKHAVCASVSLDFVKPVIAGERVDVRAEVAQIQEGMRSVALKIMMLNGDVIVTRGKLTVVFLPGDGRE